MCMMIYYLLSSSTCYNLILILIVCYTYYVLILMIQYLLSVLGQVNPMIDYTYLLYGTLMILMCNKVRNYL